MSSETVKQPAEDVSADEPNMKKIKSETNNGEQKSEFNNNNSNNNPPKCKRVYVANVPFDVKWSELKDLFREKVGNVTYCTIFENEDGKSRGCGLVEFQDPTSARKAIEVMHRSEFKSRELVVKEDLDCERDRYGRIITNHHGNNRARDDSQRRDGGGNSNNNNNDRGSGSRDRGGRQNQPMNNVAPNNDSYGYDHSVMSNPFGPPQHHNTYGLSQQFLDSLGISLPLNNRIFVANLDYKVDQNKLEEIFKLAGRVAKVKLSHDSQGQSKGYGTVEYEHPVESVQAISMFHNQKLYGRTMSVRMDKYECEDDIEVLPSKLPSGLDSIGKGLGVGGQPLNISKSIMSATLIAPPHLPPTGQPMQPAIHQAVQQPAMQQAVIAAQMQQLQQQQQQQQQQQALPQAMQPMPQQYQMLHQTTQQALQPGVQAYPTLQQLQAQAVRPPTATQASVYQQPQQAPHQPQQTQQSMTQLQQPQQTQQPQATQPQQPAANLSVYSTFERQFREASAPQNFTRN